MQRNGVSSDYNQEEDSNALIYRSLVGLVKL